MINTEEKKEKKKKKGGAVVQAQTPNDDSKYDLFNAKDAKELLKDLKSH